MCSFIEASTAYHIVTIQCSDAPSTCTVLLQLVDGLPTSQTCFFQLRLSQYTSREMLAERLRYAIQNCRSIDMDNYMLTRNADVGVETDEDD